MTTDNDADGPPRLALIIALVVAVAAVGAALTVAAQHHPDKRPAGPVPVATVPAPHADSEDCRALLEALPAQLGDYRRAELAAPAPQGAAAWTADDSEAVVLRCGLDRPADFVVGSPIQVVDHVQWFEVREGDRATWYVVDRTVYLALTLPPGSGPTPIQEVSDLIADTVAAVPIRPGPPR
ncbi:MULTISPECIES: DUF3515 domain-containing protein [Mycolicibacter]|uniref:DUF3515 domain-containing protein n=2 Tax=Mycobacteriaceae TaxID=1762 RepID=A0A9X7IM57_9MYCO|nr:MULTISPECIES: DUF3515 domain-containing protein [Mycobacteriaceae]OBG32081.1 hypothetical protein A5671_08205 [Mycolicibacter heraklionensis]OBJ28951.1 hypothetical protein A5631_18835 [Mycolicibacter heraklionensis]PQM51737.1 DUF3515 domain-containing protein [Mycolicibacter virginiensis]ULP46202.1 DUF3515 domain-containing protein [Mycolicibacter virginiensis]